MLELINKEADCLRENYDKLYLNYQSSQNNLELRSNELDRVKRESQAFEVELSTIKKSKGWKLLMFIYKIEGIFRFR